MIHGNISLDQVLITDSWYESLRSKKNEWFYCDLPDLLNRYTEQLMFNMNELPIVLVGTSIYGEAHGGLIGSYSCNTPYGRNTRNIGYLAKFIKLIGFQSLYKSLKDSENRLSKYSDSVLALYDHGRLYESDEQTSNEIGDIIWNDEVATLIKEPYEFVQEFFWEHCKFKICSEDDFKKNILEKLDLIPNYWQRVKENKFKSFSPVLGDFLEASNEKYFSRDIISGFTAGDAPLRIQVIETNKGKRFFVEYKDAYEFRDYDNDNTIEVQQKEPDSFSRNNWLPYDIGSLWRFDREKDKFIVPLVSRDESKHLH